MSEEKEEFVTIPAREWMRANGYAPVKTDGVVVVKATKDKGYPFITLKKSGTPAGEGGLNIYFSASSNVAAGDIITSEMSNDLVVFEAKYGDERDEREDRHKLHYSDLF